MTSGILLRLYINKYISMWLFSAEKPNIYIGDIDAYSVIAVT